MDLTLEEQISLVRNKRNVSCSCGNKLLPTVAHTGPGVTATSTTESHYPGDTWAGLEHLSCEVSSKASAGHEGTAHPKESV